jgi:rubrerythrin
MAHVPKIKLSKRIKRELMSRRMERAHEQREQFDSVFWVCLSCYSRMKRGFCSPDWTMGDTAKVRCPLCLSPNMREDGREPPPGVGNG